MDRPPLDAEALRRAVGRRWPRIEVVERAESTNAELLRDEAAPDRSVRVAEHQSAGRGRLDRSWISPPRAGLTFSVLVRPDAPIASWGWLPLLAGVALRDAVAARTGLAVALKWPNDLIHLPGEEKLAGILAQTSGPAVVIGIGLNVSTDRAELPVPAASSLALCGVTADRTELLAAILDELDRRLAHWSAAHGDAAVAGLGADYRAACATLGRDVSVTTTAGPALPGRAVGIDPAGRLELLVDGAVQAVGAGDVQHLRPAGSAE